MAQRAIASTGQKETETAAFASLTAADIIRAPIVQRRIPVDFRPLLKPFKRAGRLCLRIERLPQGAKLSAGRRNTDNSWSLASDELEDLDYLLSSNIARDHELTIRVMTFEDGAPSTLKLVQFPISADDATPVETGREPHDEDPVIRSQLGEMHSLFAVRESELVELRAALQRAAGEKEAEIAKARVFWERELDRKVAEALEQSRLRDKLEAESQEANRKESAAQQERQAGQRIAAELEQAKVKLEQRSEAERQKWQAESEQRMQEAREQWQADADRKLATARKAWREEQDERRKAELEKLEVEGEKRLEAERRKWRGQFDERSAKEREKLEADAEQKIDAARQAWQAESDARFRMEGERWAADSQKRIEAERETLLTQAKEQLAKEQERWKSDAEQKLEAARVSWAADADHRRHADLESWKAETEKRLEGERQTWLAKGSEQDRVEFERLRAEIESRISAERQMWQSEADEQARRDRQGWEAEAEQRVEATRRACREEAESQLAAECARLEAETRQWLGTERQRLENEIRAAAMAAAESQNAPTVAPPAVDNEIDRETSQKLEEERDKNRQLNAALAAEAGKCREIETALAEMTQRCENAERATPAEGQEPAQSDDGYIKGLRAEIVTLRRSLANQAAELGRARASLEQARPLHVQRAENKPLGNLRDVFAEDEEDVGQSKKKGLIRDCFLVSAVVIPLIVFYPWIGVYLPQPVRDGISTATAGLLSVEEVKPPVTHPAKMAPPPPKVSPPTATASRVLNVHDTAELKGTVLFSLPKGTSVVLLENEGNWTRIEVPAEGTDKARQGWVWTAYLQDKGN